MNKENKELVNINSENERILSRKMSSFININEQSTNNNPNNNNKNIMKEELDSK